MYVGDNVGAWDMVHGFVAWDVRGHGLWEDGLESGWRVQRVPQELAWAEDSRCYVPSTLAGSSSTVSRLSASRDGVAGAVDPRLAGLSWSSVGTQKLLLVSGERVVAAIHTGALGPGSRVWFGGRPLRGGPALRAT